MSGQTGGIFLKTLYSKTIGRIPSGFRLPMLVLLILHCAGYSLPKLAQLGRPHICMETALDAMIPFLPWMVSVYVASYVFWVLCCQHIACGERGNAVRFFTADFFMKLLCALIFIAIPTTNTRPNPGTGFWGTLLSLIYTVDTPENLFPSIHCCFSWLCCRAVTRDRCLPAWLRTLAYIFVLMIFFSTMAVRQHVLADVLGGWLLGELAWQVGALHPLSRLYCRLLKIEERV